MTQSDDFKLFFESQAQLGQMYPPEFINILTLQATTILREQLEKNQTPKALLALFDRVSWFQRLDKGVSEADAYMLPVEIPALLGQIVEFGGVFEACGSHSIPREGG